MLNQTRISRNVSLGETRYNEIKDNDLTLKKVYTESEIENNPNLDMVNLYYFPSENGNKSDYCLILPGGGYFECNVNKVAFPLAAKLNKEGINCFVLTYRYKKYSSYYAPLEDLAKRIDYITIHSEEYNVNKDNYMIVGYSAGGHLASLFASQNGFSKYGLNEPNTVSLIYPWTGFGSNISFNGDIAKFAIGNLFYERSINYFLGKNNSKYEREKLTTNYMYTKEYIDSINTKFYVLHGDKDIVVDKKDNSDKFINNFIDMGITVNKDINNIASSDRVVYRIAKGCNHGFGLGENTEAENWYLDCIKLWNPYK